MESKPSLTALVGVAPVPASDAPPGQQEQAGSLGGEEKEGWEGEGEEEAASPRVRLTEARLLDDRLQCGASGAPASPSRAQPRAGGGEGAPGEDGDAEEFGCLVVNDAFDMLIRKVS
jgi:hypothetical protein